MVVILGVIVSLYKSLFLSQVNIGMKLSSRLSSDALDSFKS